MQPICGGVIFQQDPYHNGTTRVVWESMRPNSTLGDSLIFAQSTVQIRFGNGMITSLMINATGAQSTVTIPGEMAIGENDDSLGSTYTPGPLVVEGDALHFDANQLTASTVDIAVEEGFVRLTSVTVDPGTRQEPSLIVTSGTADIVVGPAQSRHSIANLQWTSPCAYVCLPSGHYVDESQCSADAGAGGNGTTGSDSSSGGVATDEDLDGSGDGSDDDDDRDRRRSKRDRQQMHARKGRSSMVELAAAVGEAGLEDEAGSDIAVGDSDASADAVDDATTIIRACRGRPCAGYYAGIRLGPSSNYTNNVPPKYVQQSSTPQADSSGSVVEIELTSAGGTVYLVNERQEVDMLKDEMRLGDNLVEHRLNGAPVDIRIDEVLEAAIKPEVTDSEVVAEDIMFRIELPGFLPDSYFLYSSNQVFAKMKPGLLAILSGGLLSPKSTVVKGRLFPGFCPGPMMAEPPPVLIGQVSDLLKLHVELGAGAALVEVRASARQETAAPRYDLIDYVKTVEMLGRHIGIKYMQSALQHSTYVLAVIIISLVLAAVIGVGLAYNFFGVYRSMVDGFRKFRELCDHVYVLYIEVSRPQELAKEEDGMAAVKVVDTTKLVSKTKQRMKRLSAMKAKRERTQESTVYRVLQLKESYYQLGQFLLKTAKNSQRDSLQEFTELFMKKHISVLQVDGVKHLDFSREYEVYCTQNKLEIQNILTEASVEKLQEIGLYKETFFGAKTEVAVRLRFRAAIDIRPIPENMSAGDTSLDLFIDSEVELTPFDTDCIAVSEFRRRYELFIDKHADLVEVPITPRVMLRFSSELIRKKLTFYLAVPAASGALERRSATDAAYAYTLAPIGAALAFVFTEPLNVLFTVLIHMASTLLVPFPILLVALFSQHEVTKYALPNEAIFGKEGIFLGPLPGSFNYEMPEGLEWQNGLFIAMALLFYGLGFIELIQFYVFEMNIDAATAQKTQLSNRGSLYGSLSFGIRMVYIFCIRLPFHCLAVLFVVASFGYIGLALCWSFLAAVINPYKFLPYAAAAGTLVYASFARYSSLSKVRSTASKRIHVQYANRIQRLLEQRKRGYNKIAGGVGKDSINEKGATAEDGERFLDSTANSEFHKLLDSTGIDRSSVHIAGLASRNQFIGFHRESAREHMMGYSDPPPREREGFRSTPSVFSRDGSLLF